MVRYVHLLKPREGCLRHPCHSSSPHEGLGLGLSVGELPGQVGWTDGWTDGRVGGWMDGCMDACRSLAFSLAFILSLCFLSSGCIFIFLSAWTGLTQGWQGQRVLVECYENQRYDS